MQEIWVAARCGLNILNTNTQTAHRIFRVMEQELQAKERKKNIKDNFMLYASMI